MKHKLNTTSTTIVCVTTLDDASCRAMLNPHTVMMNASTHEFIRVTNVTRGKLDKRFRDGRRPDILTVESTQRYGKKKRTD